MAQYVSRYIAETLARDGLPWRIRLQNTDTRHAFWEAWSDGATSACINWGKLGTGGRNTPQRKTAWEAFQTAEKKMGGDYHYVSTTIHNRGEVVTTWKKLSGPFAQITKVFLTGEFGVAYNGPKRMMRLPKAAVVKMHKESGGAFVIVHSMS